MRNYFTFGEYDSRDFGVYIARDSVYNAPKRAYRQVQVPGRNGDLMIDEGRFENIDVTYPCLIYSKFDANIEGLRNALLSHKGYVRIMDSYHPDEFRLGCFSDDLSVVPRVLGDGGTFDVTFNCKPQRFLLSGEEKTTMTASGSIVNPTLFKSNPLIRVNIADYQTEYVQQPYYRPSTSQNGLTFVVNNNGEVIVNGTATVYTYFYIKYNADALPVGSYRLTGCPEDGGVLKYFLQHWFPGNSALTQSRDYGSGIDIEIDSVMAEYNWALYIGVASGQTMDNVVFKPSIKNLANAKNVTVGIGSTTLTIANVYGYVDIDSEIQDCYAGMNNANALVTLSGNEFPELLPGDTGISLGAGVESVEITPRWYIL